MFFFSFSFYSFFEILCCNYIFTENSVKWQLQHTGCDSDTVTPLLQQYCNKGVTVSISHPVIDRGTWTWTDQTDQGQENMVETELSIWTKCKDSWQLESYVIQFFSRYVLGNYVTLYYIDNIRLQARRGRRFNQMSTKLHGASS